MDGQAQGDDAVTAGCLAPGGPARPRGVPRPDLRDTDLRGADLDADLTGAGWPEGVQVPDGWIVDGGSGLLKRAGQLSEVTAHYL